MEEEQAQQVATREMVDFIRGQYPHLHSDCHFVPDELFSRTNYTALRELSSPFDGVVWRQDETELSSVCCDRTEAVVRRVLLAEAAAKCLCADDLTPGEETAHDPRMTWWCHVTTDSSAVEDETKRHLSEKEYEVIICRLCGPYSKHPVENRKNARQEVRTVDDVVYLTGVRFGAAVLGEDQLEVFKSDERFVYLAGPPGSGKTLILGLKAVHWAEEGYHVIFLGVEGVAWGSLVSRTLFQRVTEFMRSKVERANKRDRCERGISIGDQATPAPQGKKKRKKKKRTGNEDYSQSNHVNDATGCNRSSVDVSDDDTSMQTEDTTPTAHEPPLASDPCTQTCHVHYHEVAMDTHAEAFLEELVNKYQARGKGLRFVLDEIPEKMTLPRLSNNVSGIIRRLAGCVDHYEQLLREADQGEVGGQRETSATPAIEGAALVRENTVKINQHLGIVAKVMEKMVTAKEKHSVLRCDPWPARLMEVDRLYRTLCEYSQRVRAWGTHTRHHLEQVQVLLQEASGLFFNLQTWLTSFTLHDICCAIVGRGDPVDVGLWGSGVYVTYQPQSLQLKQLTRCLRCPPNVQIILEETNKDMVRSSGQPQPALTNTGAADTAA
ncbi:hypothetical protein C0Q70_21211 [Pomacea canaliculata]|uniref:Uncharacterized protein n=1 Tax=Pomacea canaliculata TaxID=400727 RepID=A0A2T7NBX2_POMCA|nr:hypothetical protein C0Q70_21211 [Pomacea canaliculata]